MNPPLKERSDEAKRAYRSGFFAGLEQAEKIVVREGYSSIAESIKGFAEASRLIFDELMNERPGESP